MNIRLREILIGIGMILIMTFFFIKTNVIDSGAHNRYSQHQRQLKELDATMNKDILEARFGLLTTYDRLITELDETKRLEVQLLETPGFVQGVNKDQLNKLIGEFTDLQDRKGLMIERFKSRNAVINNSVRYFPVAASNLIKNPGEEEKDLLSNLVRDVLTYYQLSNSELEPAIANHIALLQQRQKKDSTTGRSELDITISHARTIVKVKPEIDDLVKQIVTTPTAGKIEEMIGSYDSSYEESLGRSDIYRLLLYFFSVLLLAYIGYIVVKLRKATSAIKSANETLEQRVKARTEELSSSNMELQKSEANNSALLNAIPDSMLRTDKDGVFLDFIQAKGENAFVPLFGWQGKTIFDVLPNDVAHQTMQLAELSLKTGDTQLFGYQLTHNDRIRHYEGRVIACGESEILTIVRDITELKQAEAESHVISEVIQGISTTSNLKELLDHIYGSIGKYLYSENCFVALYDEQTEMLDLPFFVDKYDVAPPAVKLGRGMTAYIFRTGQPALLTSEDIQQLINEGEIEMVGTRPAVWLGVPLRTPGGVIGVLVVQHYEDRNAYNERDLDLLTSVGDQIAIAIERKRAEDSLKASEARFQNAFDYAPIGIGLVSPDGRWQQANRSLCDIVGYTKEELSALTFEDITHPDDVAPSLEVKRKLFEGDAKSCQIEKRYIHKQGHHVLVSTSLSLVRDAKNDPLYTIAQIQDITEQKAMEDKLQRGQKLESIGQLAAGIAHEINTPTQYVGDNVRFLRDSFQDFNSVVEKNEQMIELCRENNLLPEFVAEMQETIQKADMEYLVEEVPKAFQQALDGVERISKIVQSMKDFAHPGSTDMKSTDLNKAIESTITVASNEWKYVADVVTNYDKNLPLVPCLAGEFNQVVLNMIVNAAHAISDVIGDGSQGKGTINITTVHAGDFAEIRISDSGSGMPEEVCKKIFDPFFTTKEVGKGTGQGLAISHTVIVEKHKGTIDVQSEPGKGTTFIISLPVSQAMD